MGLFSRFKSKRSSVKSRAFTPSKNRKPASGKTSIAQTNSPYRNKPLFFGLRKKRTFRASPSLMIQPPARLRQNSPSKFKKILLVLLSLFIIGGSSYLVFFTDFFQINDFQIYDEGTETTTNLVLNDLVTKSLLNQNLLTYNPDELIQQILAAFPQYKSADFKKILPHSVKIELDQYPLAANIIDQIKSADGLTVQKKFLVNSNGMIILENEEKPELPYIKINSEQAYGLNDSPLNMERLDYIVKLTNLFEEKTGLKVIESEYLKTAREVHLRTEKDFTVWFDLSKDMNSQVDKLKRSMVKLDIYKTPLEYIDLRISGTNAEKVIYKKR